MSVELKKSRVVVVHSLDKETGIYTFSLIERGGPIVQNKDFEVAKVEFYNALKSLFALKNLVNNFNLSTRI